MSVSLSAPHAPARAGTSVARGFDLSPARARHLRIWLGLGAVLTFAIVVIGGITRLTESGLSMVDWEPIVGAVPPLGDAQWREAFARYQQFPEYQKLRPDMTLAEFQFIYFWEYLHRLVARIIGLVFIIPFGFFWAKGYLTPALRRRVLLLLGLGALQGFMGWYMVSSGLVDDPRVSHYRLAAHLSLAITILGVCVWTIRDLTPRRQRDGVADRERASAAGVWLLGGLLALQVLWGAFVAGLDAGLFYNTFPLMGGGVLPPGGATLEPFVRNAVENPITVQWVHRVLGTALLAGAVIVWARARSGAEDRQRRYAALFAWLVVAQYALGVATLLLFVPVTLGVAHQALAVGIVVLWVVWMHDVRRSRRESGTAPVP